MSRRSEKAERKKEKRKKLIRDAILTAAFGVLFLILGIIGLRSNRAKYYDYKESTDIRTVDATVVSREVHTRKDDYGYEVYYWKADVSYTVDGREYTGTKEFSTEVSPGDVKKIEVYRTSEGEYRIPEVVSDTTYKMWKILYIAVTAVGAILLLISIVVVVSDKNKK
ncbi:MAG: hypothetical protein IJM62_03205 [Lachnospiraceae bacterium]|nr:hypothetical protein [Lachnospiraceae bacterium]